MNLLFISDTGHPDVNGVVRAMDALAKECAAQGHTVSIITPQDGFRTLPCPRYSELRLVIGGRRHLTAQIEAIAPDHIHICTEGPLGRMARRYARRRGTAFSTHYMTRFPEMLRARLKVPARITAAILRRFHRASPLCFTPVPSLADQLAREGYTNLCVLPLGVDTQMFQPAGPDAPDPYAGLARPIWLYVGRVVADKNIAAFLSLDLPGTKVIVGDGPERAAFERRFPGVHFHGYARGADLTARYSAANVCVFPSRIETFGLVVLEAMACGTPVAAFPVIGPQDIIAQSKAGAVSDDLKQACEAALRLSAQNGHEQDCRAHAQGFQWPDIATRFLDAITQQHAP